MHFVSQVVVLKSLFVAPLFLPINAFVAPVSSSSSSSSSFIHYLPQSQCAHLGPCFCFVVCDHNERAGSELFVASVDKLATQFGCNVFVMWYGTDLLGLIVVLSLQTELFFFFSHSFFFFGLVLENRSCETRSPIAWS